MARTPSKEAHEKVLKAVLQLIGDRGVEGTSMDAIATQAGVSKATVYKHWENKDVLLIDAVRSLSQTYPNFDSGDPHRDLTEMLGYLARKVKSEELARIWPRIIGYALSNPQFGKALQERLFDPRRELIQRILERAAAAGYIQTGLEPEFAADLLIGPIMHRRFVDERNIPADLPERVVDAFFRAFRPASPSSRGSGQ